MASIGYIALASMPLALSFMPIVSACSRLLYVDAQKFVFGAYLLVNYQCLKSIIYFIVFCSFCSQTADVPNSNTKVLRYYFYF